ncbi:uncharacterized protein [Gossypium hirsutum]|uniref:Uncharacterized protein isoform X1 n=1 Tax=Gossypium hirsutum TaxID=3635 RepID=A0ABM2ZDM3_GOSHI|nr:uncharacterized protein LOC121212380 isoform X1 [Gossypium hirsutum]
MEHEACSGKWRQHSPAFDSFSLLPIFVDAIVDFLFSESRQGIKVNWDFLVYESVCTTPFKMATPEIEIHHRFFRNSIYSSFPNSSSVAKVVRGSLPMSGKLVTLSSEALGIVRSFILIVACIGP